MTPTGTCGGGGVSGARRSALADAEAEGASDALDIDDGVLSGACALLLVMLAVEGAIDTMPDDDALEAAVPPTSFNDGRKRSR